MRTVRKALSATALAFAVALLCAHPVFAQGCALCYNDASATGPRGQAALRHGILILAIPPMLIFATIFAVLYRRRNSHHNALHSTPNENAVHSVSEIILNLN
ncbi:MAG TPA: hypothetical protein VGS78_02345 [Candidatus Sulfotelmatobacter sp.]|nr:hypothetical protein [Candidatus Sulfotelmatobacter sp.]